MTSPRIITSIFGNRAGLTKDGFLVAKDNQVDAASTASNLLPGGINTISTSSTAYTLGAPVPGLHKVLAATSTSTAAVTVTLAAGSFLSTAGSTQTIATFNGIGQSLYLVGLSTSRYSVVNNVGVTLS